MSQEWDDSARAETARAGRDEAERRTEDSWREGAPDKTARVESQEQHKPGAYAEQSRHAEVSWARDPSSGAGRFDAPEANEPSQESSRRTEPAAPAVQRATADFPRPENVKPKCLDLPYRPHDAPRLGQIDRGKHGNGFGLPGLPGSK